ncbi:microsomal glutathione S-transferase 1 isoform X2 [Thrips palmi]|uniref:Microsomal glutathione S-transferase 1 n=1 Tax=Thrips palmi TaxID=161013 RepID=A0A6P8ZIB4_THRPL|nr:microsomal glutathione S-transferase 1 isoform X2 [Thrips palmi]
MASVMDILNTDNPVFRAYVFYSCVLVLKLLGVVFLIGRQRYAKKIFSNPEDLVDKKSKVVFGDADVERPRRAHLNDLENIPAFWITGLLYCLTNPSAYLAINLFRAFTFARIAHTFVYAVVPLPQPSRALSFAVGYAITIYMAVSTLLHFA